jgi:hypothetical protein
MFLLLHHHMHFSVGGKSKKVKKVELLASNSHFSDKNKLLEDKIKKERSKLRNLTRYGTIGIHIDNAAK